MANLFREYFEAEVGGEKGELYIEKGCFKVPGFSNSVT